MTRKFYICFPLKIFLKEKLDILQALLHYIDKRRLFCFQQSYEKKSLVKRRKTFSELLSSWKHLLYTFLETITLQSWIYCELQCNSLNKDSGNMSMKVNLSWIQPWWKETQDICILYCQYISLLFWKHRMSLLCQLQKYYLSAGMKQVWNSILYKPHYMHT